MNTDRRYDLDWLRVLALLVVFTYHSSRFFNLEDWHVKNIDTFVWVEIWNVFATRWMMLFFSSFPVRVCSMPLQNPAAGRDSMLISL